MGTPADIHQHTRAPRRGFGTRLAVLVVAAAGCGAPAPGSAPAPEPEAPQGERPGAAVGGRTVQPGAPGESTRTVEPGDSSAVRRAGYTRADATFLRDMIVHHGQALLMAGLARDRTERRDIRLLAERIATSQQSEIALMRRWLEARGEPVVADTGAAGESGGGHRHGVRTMAGMATAEELARLEAATGDAFDRLFLELMIRHHEGALLMVEALPASGGGQDPEIAMLAGHIDADQRAEIARMRTLQNILFK